MRRIITGSGLGALALLSMPLAACDDGEQSVRVQKCAEMCARYETCDDTTDLPGCEERCGAERFRSDTYFWVKAACVDSLSCNRLGDNSPELEDCVRDEMRAERPSAQVESLCSGLANKVSDCDVTQDLEGVRARCEDAAVTLSDEYLEGSEACADERCANLVSCLDELADVYDAEVRVFSGSFD